MGFLLGDDGLTCSLGLWWLTYTGIKGIIKLRIMQVHWKQCWLGVVEEEEVVFKDSLISRRSQSGMVLDLVSLTYVIN